MREGLIALIDEGRQKRGDICDDKADCSLCKYDADGENCGDGIIADHLLANGVVVQRWIPVTERLPDKHGNYLTYDQRYGDIEIYYYMGRDEWDHHRNGITDAESHGFTHWMPLPEPPKEGENG